MNWRGFLKMNFLAKLSKAIPETKLKHKLRCLFYNWFGTGDFDMYYVKDHYETVFDNFTIKTQDHIYREHAFIIEHYLKKYNLNEGDIVIDAGAYIGGFALYASRLVGEKGEIIAFEPDPSSFKKLEENIKLNNITNIITINKGVWENDTTLSFHNDGKATSTFVTDGNPYIEDPGADKINIEVVSIDNILKVLNIKKIDFIKMDVEGSEINAIKGAKETLKNNDVNLAIASYHIFEGKPTHTRLEEDLKKLGYTAQTIESIHTTTYAKKVQNEI